MYKDKKGYFQWGREEPEKIIQKFTAYYTNGQIETLEIEVTIDQRESYEKLHRAW